MGVNSLPKTVIRQRRGCDLNSGPSAPESSTLATRLPSHPIAATGCRQGKGNLLEGTPSAMRLLVRILRRLVEHINCLQCVDNAGWAP